MCNSAAHCRNLSLEIRRESNPHALRASSAAGKLKPPPVFRTVEIEVHQDEDELDESINWKIAVEY